MFAFLKKKNRKPYVSAIIAAGGTGSRMGENKLLMDLGGEPVLARTLLAMENCPLIDEIIVVAHKDNIVDYGRLAVDFRIKKIKSVVAGGSDRTQSVYQGILNVSDQCKFVCIHDGARPFVTNDEITAVIASAFTHGAATAYVPVKDTIKTSKDGKTDVTLKRDELVAIQTPQVFDKDMIFGALSKVLKDKIPVTDDCQAMEIIGFPSKLVETSYNNIKITTYEDIYIGQAILRQRGDLI